MRSAPFTNWNDVPLVCGIEETARVLGRSRSAIDRDIARGCMQPPPMPFVGFGRKNKRWQWSKSALMAWLDGQYLDFVQQGHRENNKPKGRHFFGKAAAGVVNR